MKNNLFHVLVGISILLFCSILPVEALNNPVPQVSASIFYPDTCNPEFHVDFEISNLGAKSSSASYFSVSLSSHLEFVNWYTTPEVPDFQIRFFDIGDTILNISGQPISTKNSIIEVYNHSIANTESIKITIYFELTLYQSSTEWIKYNLVMFPETESSQVIDPEIPNIINQQGYPVYELRIPINNTIAETDKEEIDVVPEFPTLILPLIFLITTTIVIIYRKHFIE